MILRRELDDLRGEWSLDIGVIEKDHVLGWLLAGVAQRVDLSKSWVFKGGTCLRKCFYETFRFSEDLDFTVINGAPEEVGDLHRIFADIADWIREESGIELIRGLLTLNGNSVTRRARAGAASDQARGLGDRPGARSQRELRPGAAGLGNEVVQVTQTPWGWGRELVIVPPWLRIVVSSDARPSLRTVAECQVMTHVRSAGPGCRASPCRSAGVRPGSG